MSETITLAMGSGGEESAKLITELFYGAFNNDILQKSEDAALISARQVMSSDSFTVNPLFFPGGDIGKLSICGTCNDLAMMGAAPKFLTCNMIIEEGFSKETLKNIVHSMQSELAINGAIVVGGDTKVVPKGAVDELFIVTTGVGEVLQEGISANHISSDDVVIVSRDIGAHGAAIFAAREGIAMQSTLQSDCASLFVQVKALINAGVNITAMRDATRGGVSAVLNEWARQSNVCIEVQEQALPIVQEVQGVCELLGFEATDLANEGTFVLAVHKDDAEQALALLHQFTNSQNAAIIAQISQAYEKKVVLKSAYGTSRFLEMPTGELLPRIC